MHGKPSWLCTCTASSMLWAMAERGVAKPMRLHGLIEALPVLGLVDGILGGADQLHAELGQHALAHQVQGAVQRGLPAHGRQQRVRALAPR